MCRGPGAGGWEPGAVRRRPGADPGADPGAPRRDSALLFPASPGCIPGRCERRDRCHLLPTPLRVPSACWGLGPRWEGQCRGECVSLHAAARVSPCILSPARRTPPGTRASPGPLQSQTQKERVCQGSEKAPLARSPWVKGMAAIMPWLPKEVGKGQELSTFPDANNKHSARNRTS